MRLIILDLDQTILDTLYRFYETFNEVIVLCGGRRVSWKRFFDVFCRDELDSLKPDNCSKTEFWREFRRRYSGWLHERDKPIKGVFETLEWLKIHGFRIVVTTGREADKEMIWWELREFGLDKYIDDVYTLKEQDPEHEDILFSRTGLLKMVIEKYGVEPESTLFVGDYWVDMKSGRDAGLITIGVLTGCKEESLLRRYGADYVIKDISHLPKLLEKIL